MLRIAALCAGVLLLVGASFISLGTALLAPIGMWVLNTWRRKHRQPVTRSATWMAAMSSVAVGMLVLTLIIVGSLPDGTMHEVQHVADSAAAVSRRKPSPAWMERVAPGSTARAAHASPTPAGLRVPLMLWGIGVTLLFVASVAGSLGWMGSMLCGYTVVGRWPNGPAVGEPAFSFLAPGRDVMP